MTTKVWVGGTGSFDDPNEWSPSGVPGAGDIAIIQIGTATVEDQKLDGFRLQLQSQASVLDVSDVILEQNFTLAVSPGAGGTATLNATGFFANKGVIDVGPSDNQPEFSPPFTVTLSDLQPSNVWGGARGVFVNEGTIRVDTGQPFAIVAQSSDAVLINDGLVKLDAAFVQASLGVSVQGTGTIVTGETITPAVSALLLATIPSVEFGGAVGYYQNLVISGSARIQIDQPLEFHALIHGFAPLASPTSPPPYYYSFYEPEIVLENTPVTYYTVGNDVLTLWNGSSLVGQLRFTDFAYAKDNFLISTSGTTTTIEPQGTLAPLGVAAQTATAHHGLI